MFTAPLNLVALLKEPEMAPQSTVVER